MCKSFFLSFFTYYTLQTKLTFLQMPNIVVVGNVAEDMSHVACYGNVPVRYKRLDHNVGANQKVHCNFKSHAFHSRTASCLISL